MQLQLEKPIVGRKPPSHRGFVETQSRCFAGQRASGESTLRQIASRSGEPALGR